MRLLNYLINVRDHVRLYIYYGHYDRDYEMHANDCAPHVNGYVSDRGNDRGNGRVNNLLIMSVGFSL